MSSFDKKRRGEKPKRSSFGLLIDQLENRGKEEEQHRERERRSAASRGGMGRMPGRHSRPAGRKGGKKVLREPCPGMKRRKVLKNWRNLAAAGPEKGAPRGGKKSPGREEKKKNSPLRHVGRKEENRKRAERRRGAPSGQRSSCRRRKKKKGNERGS